VASETGEIVLSMEDLRGVAGYAAESAQEVPEKRTPLPRAMRREQR
jgi:hypothetical protein